MSRLIYGMPILAGAALYSIVGSQLKVNQVKRIFQSELQVKISLRGLCDTDQKPVAGTTGPSTSLFAEIDGHRSRDFWMGSFLSSTTTLHPLLLLYANTSYDANILGITVTGVSSETHALL